MAGDAEERIAELGARAENAEAGLAVFAANCQDLREQIDLMADWIGDLTDLSRSEVNTIVAGRRKAKQS